MRKMRIDFHLRSASKTGVRHIVTGAQLNSLVGMVGVLLLATLVNIVGVTVGPSDDFQRTGRATELGSYCPGVIFS